MAKSEKKRKSIVQFEQRTAFAIEQTRDYKAGFIGTQLRVITDKVAINEKGAKPISFRLNDSVKFPIEGVLHSDDATIKQVGEAFDAMIKRTRFKECITHDDPNKGRYDFSICDKRTPENDDIFLITVYQPTAKALRNCSLVQVQQFLKWYFKKVVPTDETVSQFVNSDSTINVVAFLS